MAPTNVVTIGTFDGVHLGHRRILDRVNEEAHVHGGDRVAYVFECPPRVTLEPDPVAGLLLPIDVRQDLLRSFVDRVVIGRFSAVRMLSPRTFTKRVLVECLKARAVIVGEGFRFGRARTGDLASLRTLGEEFGFDVHAVTALCLGGELISSTRIRLLLTAGRVSDAAELLGRPPILIGEVVAGERIGRKLGYPTANLRPSPGTLLPADGIYLVHAYAETNREHGLLYVGSRPTVGGTDRRCEVHLLSSESPNLYEASIEIHLLKHMRDDRTFPSLGALRAQIELDVKAAGELLPRFPFSFRPITG